MFILNSPNFQLVSTHAQHKTGLDRKQRENHTAMMSRSSTYLAKNLWSRLRLESLSTAVGIASASLWRLTVCTTQSAWSKQRHKFYSCKIHVLSKMVLHNREDLVNFDRVLGISSFHVKKRSNFSFKLLNFKDFYKFNRLKIRCLTA